MAKTARNKIKGFTIPELLIATAVFSVILTISMAAFLQIGRMFYKGITISQTKDTAQHILDSVSADLQYSTSGPTAPISYTLNGATYSYVCIGSSRYIYMQGHMVDASENTNHSLSFGLLHDNAGCGDPFNPAASKYVALKYPVEILGNEMRLSAFSVSSVGTSLYNVSVYVTYGEADVLNNATSPMPTCISDLKSSEFCSTIALGTTVSKNFNF